MNEQPVIDATILDEAKNEQMNKMFLDMMRKMPRRGRHHKQRQNNGAFGSPKSKVKSPIAAF